MFSELKMDDKDPTYCTRQDPCEGVEGDKPKDSDQSHFQNNHSVHTLSNGHCKWQEDAEEKGKDTVLNETHFRNDQSFDTVNVK